MAAKTIQQLSQLNTLWGPVQDAVKANSKYDRVNNQV
jgi:hypothetical protein